jgi:hypothetical protein
MKFKNWITNIAVLISLPLALLSSCKKEDSNFVTSTELEPWSLIATANSTDEILYPIVDENIYYDKLKFRNFYTEGLIEISENKLNFSAYIDSSQNNPISMNTLNSNFQEYFSWNNRNIYFDSSIVDLISNDKIVLRFANLVNQITNTNTNTSTSTNTANTIISNSWEFHFFK